MDHAALSAFWPAVWQHQPRPHMSALVRLHHPYTFTERLAAAQQAGWNVFQFPSAMLSGGDLLSDSGTTTLTVEQFSAMMLGDEAYGSNWGYFQLLDTFAEVFGLEPDEWEIFLFHQCRAGEQALFRHLAAAGDTLLANNFFDTTRANAEANQFQALDLLDASNVAFKGNLDLVQLQQQLGRQEQTVPLVMLTITNNTGGGQPVALDNIRSAYQLCQQHETSLFLDACRFAENAWFNKLRDPRCKDLTMPAIVRQQFAHCDGFTISLKKDGLANMGGALVIRKSAPLLQRLPNLIEQLRDYQILTEGHPSYGGITGRDIMTIVAGLKTVLQEDYLRGRINLVQAFGDCLKQYDIPVLEPFGGHAVYIDTDRFFQNTQHQRSDFAGIALTGLLLLQGVRLCELGAFAFGVYDPATQQEQYPAQNFVRAAVPRNRYELQDLQYVAECVGQLYQRRDSIPRAVPTYAREKSLRHFKAKFELQQLGG